MKEIMVANSQFAEWLRFAPPLYIPIEVRVQISTHVTSMLIFNPKQGPTVNETKFLRYLQSRPYSKPKKHAFY